MRTVTTIAELRELTDAARASGARVGFVPTMGFLHAGHRTLMRAARAECDLVVVSVFVNPLQFGPSEDLAAYPRDLERDQQACAAEGVDIVFAPSVEEMYPRPMLTTVTVAEITDGLCGASRPGHFPGVATVVTKLFAIVGPCHAYFGKKDFQQLAVIRRMAADLSLPVAVVGCPTVREPDGLAMSSRNTYLSEDDRRSALALSRGLGGVVAAVADGERDGSALAAALVEGLEAAPGVTLDYAVVVRADDLRPLETVEPGVEVLAAVAARVGPARLIDNVTFTLGADGAVAADLGARADGSPWTAA